MRVTIISSDKMVYVDSFAYELTDMSFVPSEVRALQWFGANGWIEFNNGTSNQEITELPDWANTSIQEWEALDYAAKNPPPPSQDQLIAQCKEEAKRRLQDTDYSELSDVKAVLSNYPDFATYRSQVRGIYLNPVASPVWPMQPDAEWNM